MNMSVSTRSRLSREESAKQRPIHRNKRGSNRTLGETSRTSSQKEVSSPEKGRSQARSLSPVTIREGRTTHDSGMTPPTPPKLGPKRHSIFSFPTTNSQATTNASTKETAEATRHPNRKMARTSSVPAKAEGGRRASFLTPQKTSKKKFHSNWNS